MQKQFWVEAKKAVKDNSRVIGYTVWKATDASGRYGESVRTFSVRIGRNPVSAAVALHLANTLRDDLNSDIS